MTSLRLGILSAIALLAGTLSAVAAPAVTTTDTPGLAGPGYEYPTIVMVPANTQLDIGQCQNFLCPTTYNGVPIWVVQQYLSMAQPQPVPQPQPQPTPRPQPLPVPQPQPQPQPPRPPNPWPQPQPLPLPPPVYEDAGACFYSERNYGGSSFCLDEGDSYNRLRNWDNRIRSVEVFGGARVDLCTDANFYGSCVTLRSDTSRLPSSLDRKVTSLEVY